jgi:hypothetical protein
VLPRIPSRQDIVAAFAQLRGEFDRCAAGQHGIAEVQATLLGSGRVSAPRVSGAFAGTPASFCMERAVRNHTFPAFSDAQVRISIPLAL